jgi:hypothetical protein
MLIRVSISIETLAAVTDSVDAADSKLLSQFQFEMVSGTRLSGIHYNAIIRF